MKRVSMLIFAILAAGSMVGCATAGNGDGVHWSASLSGGFYDSRDGDLGYVVMGSITAYDRYPASTTLPVITQTRVKVTNVVSQDQNQSQGGGSGNHDSNGDDDCKGKGHDKHHHHGHGNGHECDPD